MKSKDIMLPDCFGFSYTLPSIAAHCDIIGFSTQKLQWRLKPFYGDKKIPFNLGIWKGIDGAGIIAAMDGNDYCWNPSSSFVHEGYLVDQAKNNAIPAVFKYYGTNSARGMGDRGGSATAYSQKWVEKDMNDPSAPFEIVSARSSQLFEDYPIDKTPSYPVFDGELLMDVHGAGCYTAQAAMKRFNRRNEQLGDAAERISVLAEYQGAAPYDQDRINNAWQRFIWHQFHDDLTGTSIPKVYEFSWNDEIIAQTQFSHVITNAVDRLARTLDTDVQGTPVLVYNPTAYTRHDQAQAQIPAGDAKSFTVINPEGKEVPSQVLSINDGLATIIFTSEVAPVSLSVYDVRPSSDEASTSATTTTPKADGKTIENSIYKVTLNENGDIASIIDKRSDKELVAPEQSFALTILDENIVPHYPAWEIYQSTIDRMPLTINRDVKIDVENQGPLRAVLKVERKYGDSTLTQRITLNEGGAADRIDIVTDIDWKTRASLLKADFPMSVSNEKARYDLGLGSIERGINTPTAYEVPAQHWASQSEPDGSYGISILNNAKYGWDKPSANRLRLTLLHTPQSGGSYQNTLDFGRHHFTYSIVGHKGDALEAGVVEKAEALNQPLLTFTTDKHKGTLNAKSTSFLSTSTPQIALKALKKAENGDGYIVRVYEVQGKDVKDAVISFPADIASAEECNGIEESKGKDTVTFKGKDLIVNASKFSPKTYRVRLKESDKTILLPESTPVSLPYNRIAISSDAFFPSGHMDDDWNSYAAELTPETITTDSIKFSMGEADIPNAVTCDGQTIALPEGKTPKQLHLLVASKNEDRDTHISIKDKDYPLHVPYFSGFYGQWGWNDHSKSFVKSGNLAHIGNHRHNASKGNVSYTFTYLYKVTIDLPEGAREFTLPKDGNIVVFAATTTDELTGQTEPALEARALP